MRRLGGRGLLLGLAAAAAAAAAARWLGWWSDRAGLRLFAPEELARYRGGPGAPGLYLALLGRVYDVSPGRRHYEPGAHYSGFAGRDASRAFVTGDYSEAGLVDDVSDLSFSEVLTLQNWLSFYEKNYELVGRVIGRFYGEDGLPTPTLTRVEAVMARGAEAGQRALQEKQKFPPCNAEWSSGRGSRLWCSTERASNPKMKTWLGSTPVELAGGLEGSGKQCCRPEPGEARRPPRGLPPTQFPLVLNACNPDIQHLPDN